MDLYSKKLTGKEIASAVTKYGNYFKITADIELGLLVLGPILHIDAVPLLKKEGSIESDIWGGWLDLNNKLVETNAVWNIRDDNPNMEILDETTRNKFTGLVKEYFSYVFS